MRALWSPSPWLLLLALASPVAAQDGEGSTKRSTRDGVYSAAQAQRGRTLFGNVCLECHESADFKGKVFLSNWTGKPVWELYEYMVESMPEDSPGTRSAAEYAAALAYILQQNGYPAGTADVPSDPASLRAIQFVAPATVAGGGASDALPKRRR